MQHSTPTQDRSVVSGRLTNTAVDAVFALSLVVLSASFVAMAVGDPELVAFVACVGVAVLLVGYAVLAVSAGRETRRAVPA